MTYSDIRQTRKRATKYFGIFARHEWCPRRGYRWKSIAAQSSAAAKGSKWVSVLLLHFWLVFYS